MILGCLKLPSGKHTKSYGKSPFLMGKLTISMAFFRSKLLVYQAGYPTSGLPPIHPPAADITNGLVQPELDGKSPVFSEGKIPRVFLKRIQKVAWGTGGSLPAMGVMFNISPTSFVLEGPNNYV
jgi:hypothetical protein